MNQIVEPNVNVSRFDRSKCEIGVVHLGFGAFHRAHQAVYFDQLMEQSGDLSWGIAAVNLRAEESADFAKQQLSDQGYMLKSMSSDGQVDYTRVRSHVAMVDWAKEAASAENLLRRDSVKMVTITVTEAGYYTDENGDLDPTHPLIAAELQGSSKSTVYAYLTAALEVRRTSTGAKITVSCCDNIRQNGKMLEQNLLRYISLLGLNDLCDWVVENVSFPCSMVDRITPRASTELITQVHNDFGPQSISPVMAEDFVQWVIEDNFSGQKPDLTLVGVCVVADVDPYEETKIRILNGGHTCLTYLGALKGIETFDGAMNDPELLEHFENYERQEVLPALTIDLPFSKESYLEKITERFKNQSIGDTIARICADGMAKFPIFIRPTIEGCLKQGILPKFGIKSIASWYVFAKHVQRGKIEFDYVEPNWESLCALIASDDFMTSPLLWGDLSTLYPEFPVALQAAIKEVEQKWPV